MSPLWWLALPIVITVMVALVLIARADADRRADPLARRRQELDRMRRALHRPETEDGR